MFEIKKFGAYVSKLRKSRDLTQSELADMLNVTRQAISKWEMGDSFPDITMLPKLSAIFNISVDSLIGAGEPYRNEGEIFVQVVNGTPEAIADMLQKKELSIDSVINVAPVLKASTLDVIAKGFSKYGIDIRHVVELANYMNEAGLTNLIKKASFDGLDEELLSKFLPFLDRESKQMILYKIIDGELSLDLLPVMKPYMDQEYVALIEAAILEGQLDVGILKLLNNDE